MNNVNEMEFSTKGIEFKVNGHNFNIAILGDEMVKKYEKMQKKFEQQKKSIEAIKDINEEKKNAEYHKNINKYFKELFNKEDYDLLVKETNKTLLIKLQIISYISKEINSQLTELEDLKIDDVVNA